MLHQNTPTTLEQSAQTSHLSTPHLWVSNTELAQHLATFFQVCSPEDARDNDAQHHILALDTEREIRRIALDLGEADIKVMPLDRSLEAFLAWHGEKAIIALMMESIDYSTWLDSLTTKRITHEEALGIAQDLLVAGLTRKQRNIELETLRKRCGVSGYDWNRYIKDLEAELHAADGSGSRQTSNPKPLKPSQVVPEIAEKYREQLAWNIQVREWFLYSRKQEGVWSKCPKEAIEKVIRTEIDPLMPDGYSHRFLVDVTNLLKTELMVEEWDTNKDVIPLRNGVLDKETKELRPHSPGDRLTHCLPFDYDPNATCEPIVDWLTETVGGKQDLVTFLLAYLNAVVNRRSDLQRYLELIGTGGSGKSTYMRLATALVGEHNTHTTKHQLLEQNRFETANLHGKALALITEADQYVGAVNVLKAITGQDKLHYEEKNKQAGEGFYFEGMVITAGNEPSRSTDYTSGLKRRKIPVWFRNHVPPGKRRDLDLEFKPYLPGLLNRILSFSDAEVTRLIRDAESVSPSIRDFEKETLCETNPIAAWIDDKLVRDSDSRHTPGWLYEQFKSYCDSTGQKPVSLKRFSNLLVDLCQVQLGWDDVTKGRDRAGRFITGLTIRADGDFSSPYPISEALIEVVTEVVTDSVTDGDGCVTAETTLVNGCDGCDAFLENQRMENLEVELEKISSVVNHQENDTLAVTRHASVTDDEQVKVGDKVTWSECPAHCQSLSPFEVTAIEGDYAKLDLFATLVLRSQLRRADC